MQQKVAKGFLAIVEAVNDGLNADDLNAASLSLHNRSSSDQALIGKLIDTIVVHILDTY